MGDKGGLFDHMANISAEKKGPLSEPASWFCGSLVFHLSTYRLILQKPQHLKRV